MRGNLSFLTKPKPCEPLLLYLAVLEEAVSGFFVRKKETRQLPMYYISKACSHSVEVLTNFLLKQVLQKLDALEHLLNQAVELSVFNLSFKPQSAIKGQDLEDFMAKFARAPKMEAIIEPAELLHGTFLQMVHHEKLTLQQGLFQKALKVIGSTVPYGLTLRPRTLLLSMRHSQQA